MNAWFSVAALLVAVTAQLSPTAADRDAPVACHARTAPAVASWPDFLFAEAQEWRHLALLAALDVQR